MFEIKRTNFLGCSKWEDIFLDYDYKNLKFYSDRIYKKLILEIKNDQILNSIKRQMCPEHKNTFSIFYYDNSKNIKELRLRCMRRFDDDKYVNLLRKNTKFDKYVFKYKNSRIDIHDYIKGFKPEYSRNPFDFYAALEGLNLIMKFKKVNTFFQNLQIKCGYIDDIQEESINQDSSSINMTEENKSKSIISWGEVELSIKNNENHINLLINQKEESDKLKN
jgi:hypothetical protein